MHETALAKGLIGACLGALQGQKVKRVKTVTVTAGLLAGVLPGALEFAFTSLSRGTPLEGAALVMNEAPARLLCGDCGTAYECAAFPFRCTHCGSGHFTVLGGEEVFVQNMECEIAEE